MTNRLMMATCAIAAALTVQASTWTGAAGDDWAAPGNWNGGVPSAGDVVEIPATQVLPKIPAGRWPAAGGRIAVWTNYKVGKLADRQFAALLTGELGEAVVLDALPDWAGAATAVAGVEYTKSACNTKVITPAEDGTTAWLKLPVNSGFMLCVR